MEIRIKKTLDEVTVIELPKEADGLVTALVKWLDRQNKPRMAIDDDNILRVQTPDGGWLTIGRIEDEKS